jgi:hypothetical protein
MKKIVFSFIFIFIHVYGIAQTKLTPGELKGKYETFIVQDLDEPYNTEKSILVYSKSNKYNNGIPYSAAEKDPRFLPMHPKREMHINIDSIKQIVYTVLNKKLSELKINKESMNILLKFEPNGNLTDIGFSLHQNTLITLEDIEAIDRQLRVTIKATFTGTQYSKYIAINYNPPVIVF